MASDCRQERDPRIRRRVHCKPDARSFGSEPSLGRRGCYRSVFRGDAGIAQEILEFIEKHRVLSVAMTDASARATPTAPSTPKGARSMPCARARRIWRNRCSSGWDKVPGPGRSGRLGQPRAQQDTDPLGHPLRGREYGDDYTVKVPGEIDVQRARRIIEELRRRFGDVLRPQEELDYIERLLKDY